MLISSRHSIWNWNLARIWFSVWREFRVHLTSFYNTFERYSYNFRFYFHVRRLIPNGDNSSHCWKALVLKKIFLIMTWNLSCWSIHTRLVLFYGITKTGQFLSFYIITLPSRTHVHTPHTQCYFPLWIKHYWHCSFALLSYTRQEQFLFSCPHSQMGETDN